MPPPGWRVAARSAAAHVFVTDLAQPELAPNDRHHLERVLRLRPGESVSVADGCGGWRLCVLGRAGGLEAHSVDNTDAAIRNADNTDAVITGSSEVERGHVTMTIGLAVTKGERPEWAVQKLTEIGIEKIVPLFGRRSVVRWDAERAERHLQRWREVARQAAMQSRQLRLPEVSEPADVATVIATEGSDPSSMALAVPDGGSFVPHLSTVLIGPEGGWTAEEESDAPSRVGLGPSVLRTETAALVAAVLMVSMRRGFILPSAC